MSLLRLDLATGAVTREYPGTFPSLYEIRWLPDGKRLVGWVSDNDSSRVVVVDQRSTPVSLDTLWAVAGAAVIGITVDPDGSGFISGRLEQDGRWQMMRFEFADPGHPVPLDLDGTYPVFSPDGRWLAYSETHTTEIWLYRFADGFRRPAFAGSPHGFPRDWK